MHPIIEQHRDELEAACQTYAVRRLEVFGSAARDDFEPTKSDLDFLVEFTRPGPMNAFRQFFGFQIALEDLFARHVDLIEMSCIRNPYLRSEINKDREVVYDAQSQNVPG
jgi:predicted nucleotidyltransferase